MPIPQSLLNPMNVGGKLDVDGFSHVSAELEPLSALSVSFFPFHFLCTLSWGLAGWLAVASRLG
jgi:hypothetical protein